MDPVSHVVFGWSVTSSRPRRSPARGTGLAITLGALAPDIDLVLMPAGWDRYLVAHEAGTHSLMGAAICGALAAGLATLIRRPSRYRLVVGPAVFAALSHVLADLLSGAAIRVGWPFVESRVGNLGVAAMGDPYVVALCAIGGVLMWASRRWRPQVAAVLLVALAVLAAVKTMARERAEAGYRAQIGVSASPGYLVEPIWASLTWRFIDDAEGAVRALTIDRQGRTAIDARVRRVPVDASARAAVDASAEWDTVRNFLRAHDFAFAAVIEEPVPSDRTVVWSDIRYCGAGVQRPSDCAVSVGGTVDAAGHVRTFARVGDWMRYR